MVPLQLCGFEEASERKVVLFRLQSQVTCRANVERLRYDHIFLCVFAFLFFSNCTRSDQTLFFVASLVQLFESF